MSNQRSDNPFLLGMDGDERRAAALRAEEERARARHSRIEAQSSPFATPQERIRLWEDVHGLTLPRQPDHRLVGIIAANTALTVKDVHDEQARRRGTSLESHP